MSKHHRRPTPRQGIPWVKRTIRQTIMAASDEFMPLHIKRMFLIYIEEIITDDEMLQLRATHQEGLLDAMVARYDEIAAIYQARYGEVQS